MITKEKLIYKHIAYDDMHDGEGTQAHLYEVYCGNLHYYHSFYSNDTTEPESKDLSCRYDLIERKDMTDEEWELVKKIFAFIWSSDYCNTCMDYDSMLDDDITYEQVKALIKKFDLINGLDIYGDNDGFEIYWDFLEHFDLDSCNFFEEE